MIIDEYGLTGDLDLPIFSKASTINIYYFWNKIEIKKSILIVPPNQEKDPEQYRAGCGSWLLFLRLGLFPGTEFKVGYQKVKTESSHGPCPLEHMLLNLFIRSPLFYLIEKKVLESIHS